MNKERINEWLKKYANYQLWIFTISMVIVAIIYINNPTAHTYKVVSPDQERLYQYLETSNLTSEEINYSVSFRSISQEEGERLAKKYNRLAWITFICIAGMMLSQKEKRQRLKEIIKSIYNIYKG